MTAGEPGTGFGLYVHWPFCQAKCPYCDFNSHVTAHVDQGRWARAFAAEIARVAARTPDRRLTSVFFGGGTPSLMAPDTVNAVMDAARAAWATADDMEVTLEANPTSVEAGRFAGYRDAGVNRVSLGVQALNDTDLARLGRRHTAAEARAAFDVARSAFDRVSFDLICARQDQSRDAWASELDAALAMAIDHISLYQLTIEPGTAFGDRHARGGLTGLPDEDLAADLYEMTVARCSAAGLEPYEVSNFARPGAESRHNLLYWSGGDYAGIGPGAHGRLTLSGRRVATAQEPMPGKWLSAVERGDLGHEQETRLTAADTVTEYILMGLRKRDGIALETLARIGGNSAGLRERAAELEALGLVAMGPERLRTTGRGRLLLDRIVTELVAG
jgi:oxygen-independent coproporphyrinogen-3 oxidase